MPPPPHIFLAKPKRSKAPIDQPPPGAYDTYDRESSRSRLKIKKKKTEVDLKLAQRIEHLWVTKREIMETLPQATTYKWRKAVGSPDAAGLKKLAELTRCDALWLLTGEGVAFPPQQPADPAGQSSLAAAIASASDTAIAALTVLASIAPLISSPSALPDETRLALAIASAQRALADRLKTLLTSNQHDHQAY